MDLPSNQPGNVFPNCQKGLDSWQTPEYCTHDFWNLPFLEVAVILFLFFNAAELEMNLFRFFAATFTSSTGIVSSSSKRIQPDFDTLEAVFLQALSIDWVAFVPQRHTMIMTMIILPATNNQCNIFTSITLADCGFLMQTTGECCFFLVKLKMRMSKK